MTSERWQQIHAVFDATLRQDPANHLAFLLQAWPTTTNCTPR